MKYKLADRRVALRGEEHFIAQTASVIGSVILEDRSSVWFGAVIRADTETIHIGEGSNVQDGSVLHADPGFPLTLGRSVTIGHMVMLHGCTIGDNCLVGIKSVVLNGAKIGNNCVIGANTLITEGKEIPDGAVVLGSPARVIRSVTDREREMIRHAADHYVDNMRRYHRSFAEDLGGLAQNTS